jgi:hypothetical protein
MPREDKKTVLRTIRLSKGLDELLQTDANSKRITVGALISAILLVDRRDWITWSGVQICRLSHMEP